MLDKEPIVSIFVISKYFVIFFFLKGKKQFNFLTFYFLLRKKNEEKEKLLLINKYERETKVHLKEEKKVLIFYDDFKKNKMLRRHAYQCKVCERKKMMQNTQNSLLN